MRKIQLSEIIYSNPSLSPFDCWMVLKNIEHAQSKGLSEVAGNLRAQGYEKVAQALENKFNQLENVNGK